MASGEIRNGHSIGGTLDAVRVFRLPSSLVPTCRALLEAHRSGF